MKKLIPLLVVFAFLTGCAGPKEPAQSPEPTPELSALSPLPVESEASTAQNIETAEPWWIGVDVDELPTHDNGKPFYIVDERVTWRVYVDWPEEGITLYYLTHTEIEGAQFVLRKDSFLGELTRKSIIPSYHPCDLSQGDYDGDGSEEYIVTMRYMGVGDDLTVCEWDETSGWTFCPYSPERYNAQLSELLTFQNSGNTVTLICGADAVSYLWDPTPTKTASAAPMEDFSQIATLTVSGDTITAAFGVGAIIHDAPKIFAVLRAELAYDGETFTLQAPHLEEMIGV